MGSKVFVGGLSWDTTDDDLKELFGECRTYNQDLTSGRGYEN